MKTYLFLLAFSFQINISAIHLLSGDQPYIYYEDGKYTLFLPDKIESVIKIFDSAFKHWNSDDYTENIVNYYKNNIKSNESPFAIICDINKDTKPDVILDGHNNKISLLISILSVKDSYKIIVIDEHPKTDPKKMANYFNGDKEYGLNYFFWINEGIEENTQTSIPILSKAIPQQSDKLGKLLYDGQIINYYYENDQIRTESQSP